MLIQTPFARLFHRYSSGGTFVAMPQTKSRNVKLMVAIVVGTILGLAAIVRAGDTLKPTFTWNDRRPIAAIHVGDAEHRSESNPAGWLYDKTIDISNPSGLADLRSRFLKWADGSIAAMKGMDAQGMIVWELDGARLGTYIGCPDQTVFLNPEIGGFADEFFARFRAQRFKVGVCIRPTELASDGKSIVTAADPYASLLRKARYCRNRWKCRLFYVDSNVRAAQPQSVRNEWQWGPLLPASIFARLHKALPDCLFITEHETEDYWCVAAPYGDLGDKQLGPPTWVKAAIPDAFSVINVNQVEVGARDRFDELVAAVKRGNIILCNGWADDTSLAVKEIMKAADK